MMLMPALELSLLLVCLWGLVAVLLTAQFNAVVIIGCMIALIVAYRIRMRGWQPSYLITNIVALLSFVVAGVIYFTTMNLLITTVYLFLLLQVTKYTTRRTLAEIRWCYLISLFHVVGASVITTAVTFGVMLVVYIFLILISLRLYVMSRGWEAAQRSTTPATAALAALPNRPAAAAARRIPRHIIRSAAFLTILVLMLSAALFSAIPRLATQSLFQSYGPAPQEPATSAFSENVEFGSFTEIQQDDAVAMFVQPVGKDRPTYVRMRAVALDSFDGKAWKRTNGVFLHNGSYQYRPIFTTRQYPQSYTFKVLQPPGVTNFLFGDTFPTELRVPNAFMFMADPMAQAVYLSDMPPKEFQYEVDSMHEDLSLRSDPAKDPTPHRPPIELTLRQEPTLEDSEVSTDRFTRRLERWAERLATAAGETSRPTETRIEMRGSPYDPSVDSEVRDAMFNLHLMQRDTGRVRTPRQRLQFYLQKCLRVPDGLREGRVPELAHTWTDDQQTTFEKAMAIEKRLRTEYGYTLSPKARGNFIESFLFDVREGHCEYFATSMAILLRNIGIPSRVVNGYYATEWNGISGNFTVRQRDAHSWVEAWMGDTYGWMTFDPTPAAGVGRRDRSVVLEQFSRIMDAVRVRWYRYVVDYSIADQATAFRKVMQWRRNLMEYIRTSTFLGISPKQATTFQFGDLTGEVDWRPVAGAALVILCLLIWQLVRLISGRHASRMSQVRFYDEILRLLANRGFPIAPGQTPREFARTVAATRPEWQPLVPLTEGYYAILYHNAPLSAEQKQQIKHLKTILKTRKPRHQ